MLDDVLVRGTAWLSFGCYIAALCGWTLPCRSTWIRWIWSVGWLIFAIHLCLAFQLVHHWSHAAAWKATQQQGGYGDGIYLNYLVALVWLFDLLWWWILPGSYQQRSRWVAWPVHGFLCFMWFNAAVIFARDGLMVLGVAGFLLLAWMKIRK